MDINTTIKGWSVIGQISHMDMVELSRHIMEASLMGNLKMDFSMDIIEKLGKMDIIFKKNTQMAIIKENGIECFKK